MVPLPSLSKTMNTSMSSFSGFPSFIFRSIMVRNSGKSISPLPSSISRTIISSSAFVGF